MTDGGTSIPLCVPTPSVKWGDANRPRTACDGRGLDTEGGTSMRDQHTPDLFDLAWAAGLFEGEGSWGIQRGGRNTSVAASLSMTDFDTVERFHAVVGVGSVRPKKARMPKHHKPQSLWRVSDAAGVQHVYDSLAPWLGTRRRERGAEVLRLHYEAVEATLNRRRDACRNGHKRTEANTATQFRRGLPARRCRECSAEASRRARAKLREDQQAETMRQVLA